MYLPTMDECLEIVKNSEAFYMNETVVEGQKVRVFDYRLASLSDFVDNKAFELRGLTFIESPDGTWERNILMNKFFNINQTEGWMYDDVKHKKIVRVQNKEDGSVISFVRFANGKVRAKSKTSFISDQARVAQTIYEKNDDLMVFLMECFIQNLTPIFEYVGPENQIVVEYNEENLVLLQVRREDGSYLKYHEIWELPTRGITIVQEYDEVLGDLHALMGINPLDSILELKETLDDPNIEGWILTFEDGQMAKIKTDKYLQLHGLIGPDAFRENLLIATILDGNIDDVVSALMPGPKKDRIVELDEKVTHQFNHLVVEFKNLRRKYFYDFREERKPFAITHSKDPLFGPVMKTIGASFRDIEHLAEAQVKDYILRQTKGLHDAKKWLEGLQNV